MTIPNTVYVTVTPKRHDIRISYNTCVICEKQHGCVNCFIRGRYFFSGHEKIKLNKGTLILKEKGEL